MRLLIVTLGLLTATAANAQSTQFYDERGLPAGRAESYGNQTNFYDSRGLPAGRSENYGGQVQYYDSRGLPAGRAQSNEW